MALHRPFRSGPWQRELGVCALAMAMSVGHLLLAQSADTNPTNTWLRRAWERHQAVVLTESERLALEDFERDPSRGPSDQVRRLVSKFQPAVNMMRRAAVLPPPPPASIGDEEDDSPFPTFERLTSSWQLSQVLRRDLLIRLNDDDSYNALERLHTLFRVVDQTASVQTLQSSLLAADLMNMADDQIDLALDHQILGPTEAIAMLAVLKRLNAEDPVQFIAAVRHESESTQQWLTSSFTGENGLKTFEAEFGPVGSVLSPSNGDAPLTQSDLDALVTQCNAVLDRSRAAFEMTDAEDAQAALVAIEKEASDKLDVFENVMRITSRAYARHQESKQRLLRRTLQLQSIADGSLDPAELANAAVRYIRATVVLGELGERVLNPIRLYAVDHATAADVEVVKALVKAQPVIERLAEGAKLKRCDFTFAHGVWPLALRHYHAGLRDAARVLHADAARLIHEQKYAEAADRLVIGYRLADHLQTDRSLAASLVALEIFQQNDDLVAAAMDARWLDETEIKKLWKAAESISDVDAFGFARARSNARASLEPWLIEQRRIESPEPDTASSVVEQMNGERLMWLELIRDAMQRPARFRDRNLADEMFAMRDVLAQDSIRDTMLQADAVRLLIRGGKMSELAAVEMPPFPNIADLASEAAREVRLMRVRLKPSRDESR